MAKFRFEDLHIWQDACRVGDELDPIADGLESAGKRRYAGQLRAAALSVSNNIAEGFERGTTNELLNFLYIARGSAGEVRSMLNYFERRPALEAFKSQISNLKVVNAI
jgi:four helix bundle protein